MRLIASVVIALFLLVGCSKPPRQVVHLQGNTMGTTYNVKYLVPETGPIEELQQEIDTKLAHVNALMSTYDIQSELSRFNQYRFEDGFTLSDETRFVVAEAIRIGHLSNGVLDVTVGPLVNLWGFGPDKRPDKVPSPQSLEDVRAYVGLDKITLEGQTLRKSHPMVYVDLSPIAKGYGVDVVAEVLLSHGVENFLVEIGGEMRVKGQRGNGDEWFIAIEKPVTTERAVQRVISIGENAVATSGDYRNYFEEDGRRYSHLIDPRTGHPINHNLVSVTVVHPSSMTADALATALMVMGWEEAIALAEAEQLAIFLIRKQGDVFEEYRSPEFDNIVRIK